MTDEWLFDQPPDCAVITLMSIVRGERPILYVSHDAEDHGWQLLDGDTADLEDAAVVAFEEIIEREPALRILADLPPGWYATRESPSHEWARARK